jgi:hypothetical protein
MEERFVDTSPTGPEVLSKEAAAPDPENTKKSPYTIIVSSISCTPFALLFNYIIIYYKIKIKFEDLYSAYPDVQSTTMVPNVVHVYLSKSTASQNEKSTHCHRWGLIL